jgi:arylformamidase
MKKGQLPAAVGSLGPYRMVTLSKIIDPATEKRRCVVRRHQANVLGVVDYHSDVDIASHLGTHVEAPYHQRDDLKDVVELASERFIGRGVLLRLDTCKPRALITRADLDAADRGRVSAGDVVILDSPYHHEPFLVSPDDERPQLSRESAEWFLEKGVKAVGFGDGIAIENNPEHCVAFHEILMPEDVSFIEVLQNLDQLQHDIFLIVFLPLPIRHLDSSPVHVVALEGIPGFTV